VSHPLIKSFVLCFFWVLFPLDEYFVLGSFCVFSTQLVLCIGFFRVVSILNVLGSWLLLCLLHSRGPWSRISSEFLHSLNPCFTTSSVTGYIAKYTSTKFQLIFYGEKKMGPALTVVGRSDTVVPWSPEIRDWYNDPGFWEILATSSMSMNVVRSTPYN